MVACVERENGRARGRHVSPSRAPVFSCAHHFQAPATQATGMVLRRNYGCVFMCSSFQFQMNKKESVIYEFEMAIKKSFCCGFILSNDDVLYVVVFCDRPPPGLKTGRDFRGRV